MRHQGEVTQGSTSLKIFSEPAKSLFYVLKNLYEKNLITKQVSHKLVNIVID